MRQKKARIIKRQMPWVNFRLEGSVNFSKKKKKRRKQKGTMDIERDGKGEEKVMVHLILGGRSFWDDWFIHVNNIE